MNTWKYFVLNKLDKLDKGLKVFFLVLLSQVGTSLLRARICIWQWTRCVLRVWIGHYQLLKAYRTHPVFWVTELAQGSCESCYWVKSLRCVFWLLHFLPNTWYYQTFKFFLIWVGLKSVVLGFPEVEHLFICSLTICAFSDCTLKFFACFELFLFLSNFLRGLYMCILYTNC